MTARLERLAVVVPAHDEEDTLAGCLAAVDIAVARLHVERPDVTVDRIVVLDACTDRSAAIAAGAAGWHGLAVSGRSVGRARAAGSAAAVTRSPVPPERVWTAHTDADSLVPEHWLAAQVLRAEAGAELVLGTVEPQLAGDTLVRWQALHRTTDDHPHVHGANLGIRADVLAALGGWPHVTSGEDVALVQRAVVAGRRVARVGGTAVRTSARRTGRAPAGFSSYLRELDADLALLLDLS